MGVHGTALLEKLGGKGWPMLPTSEAQANKDGSVPDSPTPSYNVAKNIYYWEPKSLRIRTINWWHVFTAEYMHHLYKLSIAALVMLMLLRLWNNQFQAVVAGFQALVRDPFTREAALFATIVVAYVMRMKPAVYCVENVVFVPPESWQVTHADLQQMMRGQGCFDEDSLAFLGRVLERSGTGASTHWPPAILRSKDGVTPALTTVDAAREEAELVAFPLVEELLHKSGISARDIDFLIVNCSLFTPTPSLCAMICHHFHLRQDVRSYNLGGMGCSANIIATDLAKQLLQNEPGTRALVISTENLTQNLYHGMDKSMLLQNTLFRAGGAALLMSSRRVDALRAKYKLLYTGRTQMSDDNSYRCVFEKEDNQGNRGVALSKDIVTVAGQAMKHNFVQLGPHVLPIREQVRTVINRFLIIVVGRAQKAGLTSLKPPKAYTPNFCKGIDHFCIHAGGRAVIDGVQKNLNLQEHHIRPSVQTLHDWGNTSSSSIWYEAEWIERFGNLQKGDRVLQVGFGSGFKCNSAVWVALRLDVSKRGIPIKANGSSGADSSPAVIVDKAL